MIAKIIEFSAKNRFIVFLFVFFLILWGFWTIKRMPLDALPDLSDTQVIVYTDWAGRSPDLVESQITYPITSTLLAAPKVQAVRGYSFLGSSFIYVIFKEGTDIYWARSRVLEYLQTVKSKIPQEVNPVLGPDATSLGWGFSYALVDKTGKYNLAELRSMQDYKLKLALESVPGVSQVASVGGFVKQYQITIDPQKLTAYNIPLSTIMEALKKNNNDVEGRVMEMSGREYMIRGLGYLKGVNDIGKIAVGSSNGTPIYLSDVAGIALGPEIRRGVTELNGEGEAPAGIVIVRFGENVLNVIERVKEKIKNDIAPSLPKGVEVVTTYDRSDLIHRSIDTLKDEIIKLSIAVSIVCLVFLLHLPSALVIILTLPIAIIISFILMFYMNVTSNVMSLSGIAIAIGAMVDASIIMVENAHKRLEEWEHGGKVGDRNQVIIDAAKEVGPSLFFSLLVITVGFLPVFTLEAQSGRLFKPLAYTKTFAMLFSSFLAVTLTPVLMTLLIKGKIIPEEKNPITTALHHIYEPAVKFCLKYKSSVIVAALIIIAVTAFPFLKLGTEFMPPLYEGSYLYMPVTAPALSIPEAGKILHLQDKLLKKIPEVAQVFGKAGRAETPTDPAPPEMFETVVNLKPESEWRTGMTVDKLVNEMNTAVSLPGVANSFTMPIKARIDMLATGIRTRLGIKIMGADLNVIEKLGMEIENTLKTVPGTRSVYAERVSTGYFLDIKVNRDAIARYGLSVADVEEVIQSLLGGMNLTVTVEGRERYPVNLRYARDFRDDIERIKNMLVPVMQRSTPAQGSGMGISNATLNQPNNLLQVPLSEIADVQIVKGANSIKSEAGQLAAYVYIDTNIKDLGGYVEKAKARLSQLKIPEGYYTVWSGEFEYMESTHKKLMVMIPLTLFIIFVLIFLNTKSLTKTIIVLLAVPFSLVGSFWLLYLLGYNLSIAVWVGIIAMAGLDAETGIVMLLYLDIAYNDWKKDGRLNTKKDLHEAIMYGAVKRIRPKVMTVSVIMAGLLPILFSSGTGADIMKRIAAPMVGGVVTSTILELLIYPAIYMIWKGRKLPD
ncbi:MAG TPA: CusA/CzcA family heavy metal efflux RND transporter [Candidatus Margulisbacteria bacterium]|nr:MAG: cation transporter [Candidatus Margulisbacteria bacterium GWD2_39_127]OGI01429.1 MAG: cation transporter [Candidatus Margulisbacteria bacterium GWF2_38_17]HAR64409.1 CusA/CzcA family heavy metal efflux RND transporter [Candidatus Margulisiibacteriota bacterium]